VPVPWAEIPRDQLHTMMYNSDGTPFGADPRQVLARVVERYHALGMYPVMATELEFYLLDAESEETQRPKPPVLVEGHGRRICENDVYSLDEMDGLDAFFNDVRTACEIQDVPAETIVSELGPGQFEINLKHVNNPLDAADHAVRFKRLVKGMARKHGYAATFMAKPYSDKSGNGFHVHFSLPDASGRNLFDDGTDRGTPLLRHAVAGLLRLMPESMLIFAPHMNSYRRFMEGSHAPVFANWGYENRTTAVRIPESEPEATRIEHRISGADANPYLVLAAILAGALYGIENRLLPPPPVEGDSYADADRQQMLPNRWDVATELFEQADILREYLGEEFVHVFTAVKYQEQKILSKIISDVEYESYLGIV
jgi:glutamine synthetase